MTMYLLTPTFIGSEVSLFAAIYWVAFEHFPRKFYTLPLDIEIWARFYVETPHRDYLSYPLLEKLGIQSDHMILNSRMQLFPDEFCQKELVKAQENAFAKIYALFHDKKLRLYATQKSGQIADDDFEELDPNLFKLSDFNMEFDIYSDQQPIIKQDNKTYYNVLVSLDDLLKLFPLQYTVSNKVKFASGNYFVDDTSNTEISFPGRKQILSEEQLQKLYKFFEEQTKLNPKGKQKEYIYGCVDYAKKHFNATVSYTTMRDYLKKRK